MKRYFVAMIILGGSLYEVPYSCFPAGLEDFLLYLIFFGNGSLSSPFIGCYLFFFTDMLLKDRFK